MTPVLIQTARTLLRLPDPSDIPEILRYYKDNETRFIPTHPVRDPNFYTEAHWMDNIQKVQKEYREGKSVRFFLFSRGPANEVIGTVNLGEIARGPFQACYLGYDLSGTHEGKGFMTEALQAVIDYIFSTLKLHRIMANYQPYNSRSGKVLDRLGFVVEGHAKDYLLINGEWRDHVLTSLTNPEWKP